MNVPLDGEEIQMDYLLPETITEDTKGDRKRQNRPVAKSESLQDLLGKDLMMILKYPKMLRKLTLQRYPPCLCGILVFSNTTLKFLNFVRSERSS